MEEYTPDVFAVRDDPTPPHRGRPEDASTDDLNPARHERSTSSVRRSMQDRLLTKILQQVVPVEDVQDESVSVGAKPISPDAKRPAFSLPMMGNNFRRFNARIGIVFSFQDQVERLFAWKQPSHTFSFLFVYSFICLDPHLLVVLPLAIILLFVMVPTFLARHPPPPSTSTSSITPYYSYQGPALAPARTIRPAPETSKDFFRNMRDLQNCMADFSDVHDAAVSAFAPMTNFANERLSSAVFISCTILTAALFLTSHLIPWRLIMLVGGNAGILSKHPNIQEFIQNIATELGSENVNPVPTVPPANALSPHMPFMRLLGDISLDSYPEEREVEIFEIQYRSLAPYAEQAWETFLFSPVPYDPLSPSRIAGDRPRGCRFFEDVQPPVGWAWKSKKWELDLDCREWVVERMITGVGFEVPGGSSGSSSGSDEIGGWVWDLPSLSSPRGDDDVASALGYDGSGGERKKGKKKGKDKAFQDYEERGHLGSNVMGEWRRRRWVRIVHRISMPAEKVKEKTREGDA